MQWHSHSPEETEQIGAELARSLAPGAVLALYGDLGAGKTAFVRGLARGLGIDWPVTSPTFNVVNEYPGTVPLFHFDLYRLSDAEELYDLGWEEYPERGGVVAVEWSERAEEAFPPGALRVTIEKTGENDRRITAETME
jgi:tRNA threonylcarbamoyladenosine biosynthesis protein TsaE